MDKNENRSGYQRLDYTKLKFSNRVITSEEALKNISPFEWPDVVTNGEKIIVIGSKGIDIVEK
jgi:hypothetical protein